jgi:glycosyltransferase involved in cell wall biosynthesis
LTGKIKEPDGNRPLRFGFIGAINSVKGIELLLHTYIKNPFHDTELLVAGVGNSEYSDKLKLSATGHTVRFLGRVKPADFYPLVDVVVVPSLWNEPLGTVIMEAMIFGKAVIASNTGGTPEMVVDGENGLLFNPDNPSGLLDAMARLSASQDLRARLAEGADRCRARFMDRDRFLDEHISCYMDAEHYG